MIKLLAFITLLIGCVNYPTVNVNINQKITIQSNIICTGNICCYPAFPHHWYCASTQPSDGTTLFYIRILEQ